METGEIAKRPALYELTEMAAQVQELVEQAKEAGQPYEQLEQALAQLEGTRLTKLENIFGLIKWQEIRAEAIDTEIKRLRAVKARVEENTAWLERYCMANMKPDENKLQFSLVTGSIRTNPPSVDVLDEKAVPSAYLRIKTLYEVNKEAILNSFRIGNIKDGDVSGVRIVTNKKRLVVK